MFFSLQIQPTFSPFFGLFLFFLIFVNPTFAMDYIPYPGIEQRAEKLIVQDANELIDQVDVWVDSLNVRSNSVTWMYLMLYKAEALTTISNYTAADQLIELIQLKATEAGEINKNPHLVFRILSLSADCHILRGELSAGVDRLQKALKIAEYYHEYEDQVVCHILMVEGLRTTIAYVGTTYHLNTAEALCLKHNLRPGLLAYVYDRYAACTTVYESTVTYSNKAIEYAEKAGDRGVLGSAHLCLGVYGPYSPEIKDSLFDIGIMHYKALGDKRNLALGFLDLSRNYIREKNLEFGLSYLDSVDYLCRGNDWPYLIESCYELKAHIYRITGEKDSVILYQDKYNIYKRNQVNTKDLETLYFVQKKFQDELQASTIREQDYLLGQGEKEFRLIAIFLLGAALFLLVLGYYILRLRRSKKEIESKQKEIAIVNTNLESSLEENKVLLYETHHRVKNNLQVVSSLLELQSESANNQLLENALAGAQNRIGAMAFVHELLYKQDDVKNVDLSQYIKAMSNQIAVFYGVDENFEVTVDCHNIQFPLHRAIHLGIFINELLTNSYKYARQKEETLKIHIELIEKGNKNYLTYSDNGPGLPKGLESGKVGSIGLYLLQSMAKQLRGKLIYTYEHGAIFKMLFKK